jgi:hypothetical protein
MTVFERSTGIVLTAARVGTICARKADSRSPDLYW